jgi:hypothetical protein
VKFVRSSAGFGLLEHKRKEDISGEIKSEPVKDTLP